MVMVSTTTSPTLLFNIWGNWSIAFFCSSKDVGRTNRNLSSNFLYSGKTCFNRATENPPSVSIKMTFFPVFAVSMAARSARFVFPAPAGP